MNDLFNLDGKVAVVTGGAGLIGRAMVRGLRQSGAFVYIAENNLEKGQNLIDDLMREGIEALLVHIDIADERSVENCIKTIIGKSQKIDIWINNAYPMTKDWGLSFEEMPFTSWRENVDRHLNGYCLCCLKVADVMKGNQSGSIINMGSIYGIVGPTLSIYEGTGMTNSPAYAAIKGGIINFTRALACNYGQYGIRVNCISPGGVFDNQHEVFLKNYAKVVPLSRMANPEDIAGAAIYLSSDASQYVTGHNLVVDGGWTAL